MKKTKLLTSLSALTLMLGLGACTENDEQIIPSEDETTSETETNTQTSEFTPDEDDGSIVIPPDDIDEGTGGIYVEGTLSGDDAIESATAFMEGLFDTVEDDTYGLNWTAVHFKDRSYESGFIPGEEDDVTLEGYFTTDTLNRLYGYEDDDGYITTYAGGYKTTRAGTVEDSTSYVTLLEELEDDYLLMTGSKGMPTLQGLISDAKDAGTLTEGITLTLSGYTLKLVDYEEIPDGTGTVSTKTTTYEVTSGASGKLTKFVYSYEQYTPLSAGDTIIEDKKGEQTTIERINRSEVILPE